MEPKSDVSASDWLIERFLLGELPREEMDRIRGLVESDAALRERMTALERENAAILAAHPPRLAAANIRAKLAAAQEGGVRSRPAFFISPVWAGALAALVLAVGVSFMITFRSGGREAGDEGNRLKGLRPHLLLFRRTAQGVEKLAPGDRARQDDVIQLAYQAAGRSYGVIVSIDGRGVVTRHLPQDGAQSAELDRSGVATLAKAYRLDDAPRFERFIFITSDQPFAVDPILETARKTAADGGDMEAVPLPLPDSLNQSTFVLAKESLS